MLHSQLWWSYEHLDKNKETYKATKRKKKIQTTTPKTQKKTYDLYTYLGASKCKQRKSHCDQMTGSRLEFNYHVFQKYSIASGNDPIDKLFFYDQLWMIGIWLEFYERKKNQGFSFILHMNQS